ncbi:MAG: tetratricopeptide repeat protein, partial [Bacteroidota bacterium]
PAEEDKLAAALLHQLAYLADDGIPQGWIETLAQTNKLAIRRALGTLAKYSLASWDRDKKQLAVHAVTQRVLRHSQSQSQSPVAALSKSLVQYTPKASKQERIALLPHGRRLHARLLKGHSNTRDKQGQLDHALSKCLFELCAAAGLHEESLSWAQRSLALAKRNSGPEGDADDIAYAQSLIGTALARLGRYQEACEHKQRALELRTELMQRYSDEQASEKRQAMLGEIAFTHNSLGELYAYLGQYDAAITHTLQALGIRQALSAGKDTQLIARSLNGLGVAIEGLARQQSDAKQATAQSVGAPLQKAFAQLQGYGLSAARLREELKELRNATAQQRDAVALRYKQKSLAMNESLGDKRAIAHSLHNVGETMIALASRTKEAKSIEAGIEYCRKALALRRELDREELYVARTL